MASGCRLLKTDPSPETPHAHRRSRPALPGARLIVGQRAGEQGVRAALATGGIVHLATHGELNPRNPMFSRLATAPGRTLAQAFLYAGVPNVVATLWRVDDRGAAEFATSFYRHFPAVPAAEALALPNGTCSRAHAGGRRTTGRGMLSAERVGQAAVRKKRGPCPSGDVAGVVVSDTRRTRWEGSHGRQVLGR
jgi:hypothetical protein